MVTIIFFVFSLLRHIILRIKMLLLLFFTENVGFVGLQSDMRAALLKPLVSQVSLHVISVFQSLRGGVSVFSAASYSVEHLNTLKN